VIEHLSQGSGAVMQTVLAGLLDALVGVFAGAMVLLGVTGVKKLAVCIHDKQNVASLIVVSFGLTSNRCCMTQRGKVCL
jgi:hypothetical protein